MTAQHRPTDVAVFTRFHRQYLDRTVDISERGRNQLIDFRARSIWVMVIREIPVGGFVPTYVAAVGGSGEAEYRVELRDGHIGLRQGDPTIDALLACVPKSTKDYAEDVLP